MKSVLLSGEAQRDMLEIQNPTSLYTKSNFCNTELSLLPLCGPSPALARLECTNYVQINSKGKLGEQKHKIVKMKQLE